MRVHAVILAACSVAAAPVPACAATAPATAEASAEVRLPHISVVSIGKGDTVVLIPGLASPRDVWNDIAPELARTHRVLLVQVNGFGGDTAGENGKPGMLDGVVRDLAAYLEQEKIVRPAIIGHSMGGLVGMMLAKAQPSAVGRLMVVDALPFYGSLMGPGATPDSVRPIAERMRDMLVSGPAPTQAPPNMSNTDAGKAKVLEWLLASNRQVVGQALVEDATRDFTPDLGSLADVPVTIVHAIPNAERAQLTRALYANAYASLPQAKLVPVEESAHFIMLDQPEAFAAAVTRFLTGSPR